MVSSGCAAHRRGIRIISGGGDGRHACLRLAASVINEGDQPCSLYDDIMKLPICPSIEAARPSNDQSCPPSAIIASDSTPRAASTTIRRLSEIRGGSRTIKWQSSKYAVAVEAGRRRAHGGGAPVGSRSSSLAIVKISAALLSAENQPSSLVTRPALPVPARGQRWRFMK